MRKRLLKDIIIPAGTIFLEAPWKTTRAPGHYDCVIGLSNNTSGTLCYDIDPIEEKELNEYFETIK